MKPAPSDRIYIRDLALRCIIGLYPDERIHRQDVIINLCMECDSFARAAETDDLEDTVDYKGIKKKIVKLVEASSFQLIETMAQRIAGIALENPRVQRATVSVDKPGALRFARSVAVEIVREREA